MKADHASLSQGKPPTTNSNTCPLALNLLQLLLTHGVTDKAGKTVNALQAAGSPEPLLNDSMDLVMERADGGIYRSSFSNPAWRGTIRRLRLGPTSAASTVDIDCIQVTR